ncbi:MAG: Holliday junction resolvase RuvX, partial [Pseudomonadota bacterium]|nr:Holliday junction resolvase RuvX [Pseudomonadota bacterium]
MGIDYGSVRIGLALSDSGWNRVMPFKTIAKIKELDDIVPAKNVVGFVVGLPLQTDGMEGNTAHQARLFADRL